MSGATLPLPTVPPSSSAVGSIAVERELGIDELRSFGGLRHDDVDPEDVGELLWPTLSPLQRIWMTTDGMVTRLLEAYHLEPVDVIGLDQQERVLGSASRWLDTPPSTSVIARQVLLRGRRTETVYLYATSLLVPERLPPPVQEGIARDGSSLGRLLAQHQIESRREILSRRRCSSAILPPRLRKLFGEEVLSRTYRVIVGARPMMLINENVPAIVDP